ncbi:class I SAM-dependent methyltransferase [Nocardia sp. CA-129566]|uniref:class I SAM-dependent methyltransferase n=1 Tax=Nocardia sp. CA-129566 TaxID=3239976 RepID=UPI003D96ADEF
MVHDSARGFYDGLAATYDLIYQDWNDAIVEQSRALDRLIRSVCQGDSERVLDVACGIGTQALGFAELGYNTVASDLSSVAAQRAAAEAMTRGLLLPVVTADMRSLPFRDDSFDVVVCADNAIPHLLDSTDVVGACREMRRGTAPRRHSPGHHPRLRRDPPSAPALHHAANTRLRIRTSGHIPAMGLGRRRGTLRRGTVPSRLVSRSMDYDRGAHSILGDDPRPDLRFRPRRRIRIPQLAYARQDRILPTGADRTQAIELIVEPSAGFHTSRTP